MIFNSPRAINTIIVLYKFLYVHNILFICINSHLFGRINYIILLGQYYIGIPKFHIPSWNTDFLASNNFFHTLLNSRGVFDRAGFFHSPDLSSRIFPFTKIFSFLSRVFSFTLIGIFDLYSKKEIVRRFFTFSEKN